MKRQIRRMKEYGGDTSTWYWHGNGVSDLVSFIAETMDDELPAGGLIGEMNSYSGDGQPTINENGGRGGKTFIEMSLFAPFDLPYTTGYEFGDKATQYDYDREVEEFSKLAEKDGIPYDSDEWLEEFIDYFSDKVVDMSLLCMIDEFESDDGVYVSFTLSSNLSVIDTVKDIFISYDDLRSKNYEKEITSTIRELYYEV